MGTLVVAARRSRLRTRHCWRCSGSLCGRSYGRQHVGQPYSDETPSVLLPLAARLAAVALWCWMTSAVLRVACTWACGSRR